MNRLEYVMGFFRWVLAPKKAVIHDGFFQRMFVPRKGAVYDGFLQRMLVSKKGSDRYIHTY
jgi:hypothetical protein